MPKIYPMFAAPFSFSKLEDCTSLNDELRRLFLAREQRGELYANPNPLALRNQKLFESNFDLFKWPEPCIQRLRAFCWAELMQMVCELNQYERTLAERIKISADAWFHITRHGGFFGLHNHPMASWSGVYCVSVGRDDAKQPESGLLTFVNPFVMTTMFVDAGTAQMQPPFSTASRSYRLQPGQLVIFPSWVLHEVKPYHGEGERITVAFNTWFHVDPAAA